MTNVPVTDADREAAQAVATDCRWVQDESMLVDEIAEAIARARAEGYAAGYEVGFDEGVCT